MNRRQFISSVSVAALAVGGSGLPFPSFGKSKDIRWSMGWILWRNYPERQIPLQEAVQDMHNLGLEGIEFTPRKEELARYGLTREHFRDMLKEKGLRVSGHYFGAPFHDVSRKKQILASFYEKVESLKFYGSKNIIIGPPGYRAGSDHKELIRKAAPLLNELGKMAHEEGIEIGIHPHYNCIIETPEEIHLSMELTDPKYVFLSADTGHIALGGGNVVEILRTYQNRLNYFHFKDVAGQATRAGFAGNLREMGQGEIDFPAVMALLEDIKYKGWINVEQDATKLTPRESAVQSMEYINRKLKAV
jgi:inosose dehydratase